jgi:hypothetical protein
MKFVFLKIEDHATNLRDAFLSYYYRMELFYLGLLMTSYVAWALIYQKILAFSI